MKFKDICRDGICEICGKKAKVVVFASTMEAASFAHCENCLDKEPYCAIIGCYSYSEDDDIKQFYDDNEKLMKEFYCKTFSEFFEDCSKARELFLQK